MRNLLLLMLVIVIAFVVWNRSQHQPTQTTRAAGSHSGGPVRQLENEPSDMMAREGALPPPGGMAPKAMLDTVRQGLDNSGQR